MAAANQTSDPVRNMEREDVQVDGLEKEIPRHTGSGSSSITQMDETPYPNNEKSDDLAPAGDADGQAAQNEARLLVSQVKESPTAKM